MIQWEEKALLLILSAPGKLSLQLQGWETLGYSSFTPVLVSLSFTQMHTHMYTHTSALHLFSLQHKFLCSLAFIQAHSFPGRQAVYFLCTFNSKYTYIFPSSHFHMCKEALKQSTSTTATTCTLLWHFFFLCSIGRGHPVLSVPTCWPSIERAEGVRSFFSLPSLPTGHAKMGLVPPEVTVKKLPTFPYS